MDIYPYSKVGRDFTFPEYDAVYPRDPRYKIYHYKLEIWIYPSEKKIVGNAELEVSSEYKIKYIELDAVDLNVNEVYIDGAKTEYDYDGEQLVIYFNKYLTRKRRVIRIGYSVKNPQYGIYFVEGEPLIVYSQGETEWHRYWMPIYDYPNMKFTTELIIHVPREWKAFANGRLIDTSVDGEWSNWHYLFDYPHSSYLIALAAGKLSVFKDKVNDIDLEYVVPEGREREVKTTFRNTPDMIRFFSEWTGVKYPYRIYRQVVVREFIVGGMENTSMTILTDRALLDEHARLDQWSEGLLSHELAHQWFGDLVTCKDWSHIWLNESFATLMADLYFRHWRGVDDYIYGIYNELRSYLNEYKEWYSRPIVYKVYKYSEELFDGHSYPKGAVILHMLMNLMGEDVFRKAIKVYLNRFKFKPVDTEDFRKVLEEVYGRSLEWFFDQFIYNSGHPVLKVRYSYDREEGLLKVTIKQEQGEDSLEVYKFPVDVEIVTKSGKKIRRSVWLDDKIVNVTFKLERKPLHVYIDPEFKVFAVLDPEYPVEDLIKIASESDYLYWRLLAIKRLGNNPSTSVADTLYNIIIKEEFYGLGREAAKILGSFKTGYALEKLLEALDKVSEPRIKSAILEALGEYRNERVGEKALNYLENKEEAYSVRALAVYAIGKSHYKDAVKIIKKYIDEPSYADIIRIYSLRGLGEYGGDEAYEILKKYSSKDYGQYVRMVAIEQLGNFPEKKKEVLELLKEYAYEKNRFVRRGVINACRKLAIPQVLPILDIIIYREKMGFVWKPARLVKKKLSEAMEKGIEYKKLREELEKIKEEARKLGEKLELLEVKRV